MQNRKAKPKPEETAEHPYNEAPGARATAPPETCKAPLRWASSTFRIVEFRASGFWGFYVDGVQAFGGSRVGVSGLFLLFCAFFDYHVLPVPLFYLTDGQLKRCIMKSRIMCNPPLQPSSERFARRRFPVVFQEVMK